MNPQRVLYMYVLLRCAALYSSGVSYNYDMIEAHSLSHNAIMIWYTTTDNVHLFFCSKGCSPCAPRSECVMAIEYIIYPFKDYLMNVGDNNAIILEYYIDYMVTPNIQWSSPMFYMLTREMMLRRALDSPATRPLDVSWCFTKRFVYSISIYFLMFVSDFTSNFETYHN